MKCIAEGCALPAIPIMSEACTRHGSKDVIAWAHDDIEKALTRVEELEALLAEELEALLAESRWVPMAERLPDEFKNVLTFSTWPSGEQYQEVAHYVPMERCFKAAGYFVRNVSHWCSLPAAPGVK